MRSRSPISRFRSPNSTTTSPLQATGDRHSHELADQSRADVRARETLRFVELGEQRDGLRSAQRLQATNAIGVVDRDQRDAVVTARDDPVANERLDRLQTF